MKTNVDGPVAMTIAIKNAMDADEAFAEWAIRCLARHLDADWGDVGLLTWQSNEADPEMALSTYRVPDEHRRHVPAGCESQSMWITQDGVATTMLWPAEY